MWAETGDKFNGSLDIAQTKFKSWWAYMKSEETKLQGEKSGSGAIDQVCSWFTCKAMAFILSRNVPEKGRESSTTVDEIDVHSFNSLRNLNNK